MGFKLVQKKLSYYSPEGGTTLRVTPAVVRVCRIQNLDIGPGLTPAGAPAHCNTTQRITQVLTSVEHRSIKDHG